MGDPPPCKRSISNYITVEQPKSIHKKTKEMLSPDPGKKAF